MLVRLAWSICEEVFKWNSRPRSLKELSEVWLMGKGPLPKRLILFIFAGFTWALWTTRNKMSIEQKFPKAPTDVVYLALSYLQKWSILLKDADRDRMEAINGEIMGWMRSFKPNEVMASDIIEL